MSEARLFDSSLCDTSRKLDNFEKYVRRQAISRFLAKYELFKLQVDIKGSIVECGVHHGGGVMAWAKLSAAMEPYAIHRKVIGFDTFEGFPEVTENDAMEANEESKIGGFSTGYDTYSELALAIDVYDKNRYLSQFNKIELIKGDATETIPKYVSDNRHLLVSLLYLDFDLYEPTKAALQYLLPRVPKGGVVAFDEINNRYWPGETIALLEEFNVNNAAIRKFPFDPNIAYLIL